MHRANNGSSHAPRRSASALALAALTRAFAPSYQPAGSPRRTVAIVVPVSSRPDFTADEEVSFRHLTHFLGAHDKYLVAPVGVRIQRQGFRVRYFPRKFFGSAAAHNRLLIWPGFYRAFEQYEYILMYHLDSLAFGDQLLRWCRAGWDYIGAPWIPCADTPWVKEPRVGNGGFTLMKVRSMLQVLSNRYRQKPNTFWTDLFTRNGPRLGIVLRLLERLQRSFPESSIVNRPLQHWRLSEDAANHGRNNDYFWSFEAAEYLPAFKVAPFEQGLRFAFEAAPRLCFELNGRTLPFGCHAWTKFDRGFWESYLLPSDEGGEGSTRVRNSRVFIS